MPPEYILLLSLGNPRKTPRADTFPPIDFDEQEWAALQSQGSVLGDGPRDRVASLKLREKLANSWQA